MPVSWKPTTVEAHNALQKKTAANKDPEWEEILQELERGNAVQLEYADIKERSTLARSLGRRASFRGFKVDLRNGPDYISARMIEPDVSKGTNGRKSR